MAADGGVTDVGIAEGRGRSRSAPPLRPLRPRALEADDVLEALPRLTYVTDADGLLLACSRRALTSFARRNDGASIADPEAVLGRSIYAAMKTERTQHVHRRIADGVLAGDLVSHRWCCDCPGVQRNMRMTIRALRLSDHRHGLLYHSRTLTVRYVTDVRARTAGAGRSGRPVRCRRRHCGTCAACAAPAMGSIRRSAATRRRRPGNTRQPIPPHDASPHGPIASHTAFAPTAGRT